VMAAIKNGAGQVVKTSVEQHEVVVGYPLDRAYLGNKKACITRKVSTRLDLQPDLATGDEFSLAPGLVPGGIVLPGVDFRLARTVGNR
jgi:hypothetical protein